MVSIHVSPDHDARHLYESGGSLFCIRIDYHACIALLIVEDSELDRIFVIRRGPCIIRCFSAPLLIHQSTSRNSLGWARRVSSIVGYIILVCPHQIRT